MEFNQGIPISKNEMLRWNTPKDELFKVGTPIIDNSKTFARWCNIELFKGHVVNVTVNFQSENPDDKLVHARIECPSMEYRENADAPRKIYQEYTTLLVELFGAPTNERTIMSYPQHVWEFADHEIILGIAERFMEYSIFVIRIKPNNNTSQKVRRA